MYLFTKLHDRRIPKVRVGVGVGPMEFPLRPKPNYNVSKSIVQPFQQLISAPYDSKILSSYTQDHFSVSVIIKILLKVSSSYECLSYKVDRIIIQQGGEGLREIFREPLSLCDVVEMVK